MGYHPNISHNKFPKQGNWLHRKVKVCFNYDTDTNNLCFGTIVRDDMEEPFKSIIKLDDGRVILTTECQYSPQ